MFITQIPGDPSSAYGEKLEAIGKVQKEFFGFMNLNIL